LVRIERTARFDAPIREVFAYIADFRSLKEYNPSILAVESDATSPPGEGTSFSLTLSLFVWKLQPRLTITEFKEDELIATRLDAFIPAHERRSFEALGEGTLLSFSIEFDSGWPLVGPLVDRLLARLFAGPQADTEIRLLLDHFNR
jgi:hypothetical protein